MSNDLAPWEERWVWLAGSLLLACLVSWIGWAIRNMGGRPQKWYGMWRTWRGRPWIEHTVRLLYAVGIPTTALFWRGVLKEGALGLKAFPWQQVTALIHALPATWADWVQDALWAMGLGIIMMTLVALAQRQLSRAGITSRQTRRDITVSLREAAIHESHWAFYREPFILLWGTELGVWAGALLVLLEAAVNPARWTDLRDPTHSRGLLLRAALAICSGLVFLLTQNFWLMLLTHTLLGWWWGE
ncbi:MAG: hypothetical protein BWY63_01804 [Chloroflexi bacterium ADurb.Bin360]|nr:MAG: hypothetical protein BWY63_01804 [Chloroflexi bacterium ADurb.Bin360]